MSLSHADGDTVYEVYLVDVEVAGHRGLASPVRTRDIRYYDSGIWIRNDGHRTFFPYGQVRRIEERETDAAEQDGEQRTGERERPPRSGDWRDDADPNLGGDLADDTVPADEI